MWQIRRFKSSIFCKLKAKFNMHFKLQKDRARAFLCNGQKLEWVFAKEHLLRHQSLEILRLESVYSYSNSIYRMKIVHFWNLIYSSRLEAWRKVANKSTTQICSEYRRWTVFKSLKCFVLSPDTSFEGREAFSKLQLHEWFISLSLI